MMPFFKRKAKKSEESKLSQQSSLKKSRSLDVVNGIIDNPLVKSNRTFQFQDLPDTELLDSPPRKSRLSKNMEDIVRDRAVLPYFTEYLDAICRGYLLRFWLDVESFHVSASTRLRTQSLQTERQRNCQLARCLNNNNRENGCTPIDRGCDEASGDKRDDLRQVLDNHPRVCDSDNSHSYNQSTDSHVVCDHSPTALDCGESDSVDTSTLDRSTPTDLISNGCTPPSELLIKRLQDSILRDALLIYSTFIAPDAPYLVPLPDRLRSDAINKICQEDGSVDIDCFLECQEYVLKVLEKDYLGSFRLSAQHVKYHVDMLTSGKVYLSDFLYNENALFYFTEYMEREGAASLMQFVLMTDNFQQHLQNEEAQCDPEQAQNDAIVLYEKFFSLQATEPLGFSNRVRFDVESNICREEGPHPDCFALPRCIALKYIEKEYFQDFLKSEVYYKYLTELISSVQRFESDTISTGHRRAGSASSSEYSQGSLNTTNDPSSTRNTLLATGQKSLEKSMRKFSNDFRMDCDYLNPDNLWKRNNAGPLKLGQVDGMGQFTSYFQPEPDSKKTSRLFKKNIDKLKEEEQMALKIAEMIVSDVTSVTLATAKDTKQSSGGDNCS